MRVQCYDERAYYADSVNLHDPIKIVDIHPVGISLPAGKIKLNLKEYVTHLKFDYQGTVWIVSVYDRNSLGGDLVELSYKIDYVKDYWYKYSDKNAHAIISRTTDSALWSKFVPDNLYPVKNESTVQNVVGNVMPWSGTVDGYRVIIAMCTTYSEAPTLFVEQLTGGLSFILGACTISEKLRNAIQAIFLVPTAFTAYFTTETVSSNDIMLRNATWYGDSDTVSLKSVCGGIWDDIVDPKEAVFSLNRIVLKPGSRSTNLLPLIFDTGINVPHIDWRDSTLTEYSIYIPFVGNCRLNATKYYGDISIAYYLNPFDGTIKASINNDWASMTAPVKLPSIPFGGTNMESGIIGAINSALIGAASAVATVSTGAPLSAVVASSAPSIAGSVASLSANETHGLVYSTVSGYESIAYPQPVLTKTTYSGVIPYNEFVNNCGYIANRYIQRLSDAPTNRYVWFDMSNAVIYGGDDYAAAVRLAYHNNRIFVN